MATKLLVPMMPLCEGNRSSLNGRLFCQQKSATSDNPVYPFLICCSNKLLFKERTVDWIQSNNLHCLLARERSPLHRSPLKLHSMLFPEGPPPPAQELKYLKFVMIISVFCGISSHISFILVYISKFYSECASVGF